MDIKPLQRRTFIRQTGMTTAGLILAGSLSGCGSKPKQMRTDPAERDNEDALRISLAQWSLNKPLKAGELDNLAFAEYAKSLDIHAIEYVNQFFPDKAKDKKYLDKMNSRADDVGVRQLLIMIDHEGDLGSTKRSERNTAIENHFKWVEAAKYLGCHSIRVNAAGQGSREEVQAAAIEALGRLCEFAKDFEINILVENHGGYSSDGQWLSEIMKQVKMDNFGSLPDFGNFCVKSGPEGCEQEYDRYKGLEELMPYAKAVSAKANDFDQKGNEIRIDYERMIGIVKDAGYTGYIGIEYEGPTLSPKEGILATKKLLERFI